MRLIKVGRDQSCDLRLNSPKVSSLHAEITILNNGDMLLEDKGSTNGTYIMNRPIKPGTQVPISRGDAVRFGDTELVWSMIPPMEDLSRYKGIYGIGKHSLNEIRLDGATVSRFHATLKKDRDDKVYIEDHSKNGTSVNGEKLGFGQRRRVKRGDAIVCGGVTVPDSYLKTILPTSVWPKIVAALGGVVALVCIVCFFIGRDDIYKLSDAELYRKYNKSVAMIYMKYHYKATAGDLNLSGLEELGIYPEFVAYVNKYGGISMEPANSNNLLGSTGTGFWVSNNGLMVTNLHMLKPWLFDQNKEVVEAISNHYKEVFAKIASIYPTFNAYTAQIKIEGVVDYWGVIPDGKFIDTENLIKCREVLSSDNSEIDLALVQSVKGELPPNATYVDLSTLVQNNDEIVVGSHIYTMGYPFGFGIQDFTPTEELQLYARGGSITRQANEYRFSFDAASFGGASGSPIFNEYGNLIGVLDSGVSTTQGFNFGMKAKHVKDLVDKYYKSKQ